ncbi:MAG: manganese efflux pump MntP family protein [Streptosporangiaceae bacterium]
MYALLLVAASVGLSNFAAAISIGTTGVDARTRLRVGLVFGVFETGMPVVGLLLGNRFAGQLGHSGRWIGGALLIAVGLYALVKSILQARSSAQAQSAQPVPPQPVPPQPVPPQPVPPQSAPPGGLRLVITGFALSIDNLVIGFALGTYQIAILPGVIIIGAVSVVLSLLGLELGARIGRWAGQRGEQLGGLILISVGILVGSGQLS